MATYTLLGPVSGQAQFDQIGRLVIGGKVKLFVSDTTAPKTAYTTADLSVAHPWPMPLDSAGRVPAYYCAAGAYDLRVEDAYGELIGAQFDALVSTITIADPDPTPAATIVTGAIMALYSRAQIDGWVICNGLTIGPTGSSADTASNDCEQLFLLLWSVLSLTVSGGRGASAPADWAAGKTITTPDLRGCTLVGRDSMGTSAAGRLTALTTSTPDTLGTFFGLEGVVLTEANLATHSHAITPNVSLASAGAHTHPGSVTDVLGAHTHGVAVPNPTSLVQFSAAASAVSTATNYASSTFATDAAGAHGHNVTVASDGSHTHTVTASATADNAGSDTAHANVQPSALITWFIKL